MRVQFRNVTGLILVRTMRPFVAAAFVAVLASCQTTPRELPPKFYTYWQPGSEGTGLEGTSTSYYVELFSRRGPREQFNDALDRDFYYACLGDTRAFRRFLHSKERGGIG